MTKTKSKHGTGTLTKRGKKGIYYLRYYINGKQTTQRLTNSNGQPITHQAEAEKARQDLLAPLAATTKENQLKAVKSKLEDFNQQKLDALKALKPSLRLDSIWTTYRNAENRERSGEATLKRYRSILPLRVKSI